MQFTDRMNNKKDYEHQLYFAFNDFDWTQHLNWLMKDNFKN